MESLAQKSLIRAIRNPLHGTAALLYRHIFAAPLRTIGPSANRLRIKSRPELRKRELILEFGQEFRTGEVHDWYMQGTRTFVSLEYRKEQSLIGHEFIVVQLDNNEFCRFDRMADYDTRLNAPLPEGTKARDTARLMGSQEAQEVKDSTDLLLSIDFPNGEDLKVILAVCYSIKTHPDAQRYNLFLYNCYFFSWSIVCVAARRAVDWSVVTRSEEPWATIVQKSLSQLSYHSAPHPKSSLALAPRKLRNIFKKTAPVQDLLEEAGSNEERFKQLLQSQLIALRDLTGQRLQELLLRSQLEPELRKHVSTEVQSAAIHTTRISSARAAGAVAMREITSVYSPKMEKLEYGGFEWSDHCNIAWAVTSEAAAAAADTAESENWGEEWDRIWQRHWDAKTIGGDTAANKTLGARAGRAARVAWREEWDRIESVRMENVAQIVESMHTNLLERIPDLDDKRLKIGERASAEKTKRIFKDLKARGKNQDTQPALQDFIRTRIASHCQRVQNVGFGWQDEALEKIEGAMHKVWLNTLEVMSQSS